MAKVLELSSEILEEPSSRLICHDLRKWILCWLELVCCQAGQDALQEIRLEFGKHHHSMLHLEVLIITLLAGCVNDRVRVIRF
jgi:hypothetical protein